MRFIKGIALPVFIYTEEEVTNESIGVPLSENAGFNEVEKRIVYSVDMIWKSAFKKDASNLRCGTECYVVDKSIDDLQIELEQHAAKFSLDI